MLSKREKIFLILETYKLEKSLSNSYILYLKNRKFVGVIFYEEKMHQFEILFENFKFKAENLEERNLYLIFKGVTNQIKQGKVFQNFLFNFLNKS